jgi:hypothetical protein
MKEWGETLMENEKIKEIMRAYGITYGDMGKKLNRSPATVKQRLDTDNTFYKHAEKYKKALEECIEDRQRKVDRL